MELIIIDGSIIKTVEIVDDIVNLVSLLKEECSSDLDQILWGFI